MLTLARGILHEAGEYIETAREKLSESERANYFIKKRAVLHGLPFAIVSSVALGLIFGVTPGLLGCITSYIHGGVNYTIATGLIELYGPLHKKSAELNDYLAGGMILLSGHLIATAFVNTVLKANLTYIDAIALSAGALMGHFGRKIFWNSVIIQDKSGIWG